MRFISSDRLSWITNNVEKYTDMARLGEYCTDGYMDGLGSIGLKGTNR